MPKIRIDSIPEGFEVSGRKLHLSKKQMGGKTGDQQDYGMVTIPNSTRGNQFNKDSEKNVRYSLSSVPREVANIEAEGGETVLTDLNDDGNFGLYNIKGPRHSKGGVPMYLTENSFVFSDTAAMKMAPKDLAEFGIKSRKKMTPAKVSQKFNLNKYMGELESPDADPIRARSAELMLNKNSMALSKLAFAQEAKKNFSGGVPDVAYPYLISKGIDPKEFVAKVEQANAQQPPQFKYGGKLSKPKIKIRVEQGIPNARMGGDLPKYQVRGEVPFRVSGQPLLKGFTPTNQPIPQAPRQAPRQAPPRTKPEIPLIFRDPNKPPQYTIDSQPSSQQSKGVKLSKAKQKALVDNGFGKFIKNGRYVVPTNRKDFTIDELIAHAAMAEEYGISNFTQGRTEGYFHKDGSNGKWGFVGGFTPRDYERRIVASLDGREGLKDKSDLEIRKRAFDILGINLGDDVDLSDDAAIYNNKKYFDKIYEAFTKYLPQERFRKDLGNDRLLGLEHYDALGQLAPPSKDWDPLDGIDPDPIDLIPIPIDQTPIIDPGDLPETTNKPPADPRFWQQDMVKLAALAARDRDMFTPWQPEAQAFIPRYVLEDPTRALANINEQLNIGSQAAATFAGPQSLNARLSEMQGKSMSAAADVLAQVNARNVNTVNQGLAREATARQAVALENDKRNVKEYDDSNIAMQQYINERNLDREQLADLYANALTNRANTYNLNTINRQFNIDPTTGGMISYMNNAPRLTGQRTPDPTNYGEEYRKIYAEMLSQITDPAKAAEATNKVFERMYPEQTSKVSTRLSANPSDATPNEIMNLLRMQGAGYAQQYPGVAGNYSPGYMNKKGGAVKKPVIPFYTGKFGV